MVMESEHMVDGDVVDDGGGEYGIEIPLFGVESRTNLTPKRRSWWWQRSVSRKAPFSREDRFSGYIRGCRKGGGETTSEVQAGLSGARPTFGCATSALLSFVDLLATFQSPISLFR
jgi:hypothetical protein